MCVLSLSVFRFVLHAFFPFWGVIQKKGEGVLKVRRQFIFKLESVVCALARGLVLRSGFVIRVSWSKVRMFVVRRIAQSIEV